MEIKFVIQLDANPAEIQRLQALQVNFVDICNAISPIVQETHTWNRVVLHHMVYHKMREKFPHTGSQMICNAIYSVCRAARIILQHPKSPWNIEVNPQALLPRLHFLPQSPVFFDRHTLNLKGNRLSMYTLDGRIRFDLSLTEEQRAAFHHEKLKEVLLVNNVSTFSLHFHFGDEDAKAIASENIIIPDNVAVIPPQPSSSTHQMAVA
ncbi:MAG: hypothetical protein FJY53_06190 [Betaproteobacteria bacterium]|nr:hypothetical protein [Betaproteobacteria bacterium]